MQLDTITELLNIPNQKVTNIVPEFNKEVQHLGKEGILSECTNKHINISPAKRETR